MEQKMVVKTMEGRSCLVVKQNWWKFVGEKERNCAKVREEKEITLEKKKKKKKKMKICNLTRP